MRCIRINLGQSTHFSLNYFLATHYFGNFEMWCKIKFIEVWTRRYDITAREFHKWKEWTTNLLSTECEQNRSNCNRYKNGQDDFFKWHFYTIVLLILDLSYKSICICKMVYFSTLVLFQMSYVPLIMWLEFGLFQLIAFLITIWSH